MIEKHVEKYKSNVAVKFDISLSDEQKAAKEKILKVPFTFLHGMAGSGKTILAAQIALDLLFKKEVSKIVITRPTVGTEDNGFLPGTLEEKLEPWLVPIRDNMRKVYNKPEKLKAMEQCGQIQIIALSHFRGITFDNCICLIDEYENLNKNQLKMAIGRLGKDSKMIFCGDYEQIDLKNKSDSAIHDVIKLKDSNFVEIIDLKENHRHEAITELLNLLK